MRHDRLAFFVLGSLALLALIACGPGGAHDSAPAPAEPAPARPVQAAALADAPTHAVRCGCSIEDVGKCGNFIEVEGRFVELVLPEGHDLGEMPFCGQNDLVAHVRGDMRDGKFVATAFAFTQ